MVYSFELFKHANIRYRDAVTCLARCELQSMLRSLSVSAEIVPGHLGGAVFLTFACRELSEEELSYLSGHSSLVFLSENRGGLLRPLSFGSSSYLPDDLPEILKFKGKTNVLFTRMMINTALSLTPFRTSASPPLVFDPVCGKATACFCALTAGMNSVGVDANAKYLSEASDYFTRYLKFHKLKHEVRTHSETFRHSALPVTDFVFADSKEHFLSRDTRSLTLCCADTGASPALFRRRRAHVIVADLPYGVQHAPRSGQKVEPLPVFLRRVLPVWRSVLAPGGALALSFNTLILPSSAVRDALESAGFSVLSDEAYTGLRHEVEQAVVRDVIFALNSEEES